MTTATPPPSTGTATPVPLSTGGTSPSTAVKKGLEFRLKVISFFRRQVGILCQNENGPCPLLAVVNVLLLQGKLHISTDRSYISLEDLNQLLAEAIIEESAKRETEGITFQHHVEDVLHVIPTLAQGLDLNVYFNGVNKYEFTQEISIFDTLSIPLLHGWIYDDHEEEAEDSTLIASQSYNHLMFQLVEYKALYDKIISEHPNEDFDTYKASLKPEELDLLTKGAKIEHFLNLTASQLTYKGLLRLYDFMNDRQLAVFFRNNHFSTIFCYQGQLFLLLTDLGFSDQPDVVWELLEGVDGKSDFFTSDFQPISSLPTGIIQSGAVLLGQVGEMVGNAASSLAGTIAAPPKNYVPSSKKSSEPLSPISDEQLIDTTESPMHASMNQSTQKSAVILPPPAPANNTLSATTEPNSGISSPPPVASVPVSTISPQITATSPVPEVDSDLMLAMQLQQQYDRELNSAAPSSSSPSSPTVVSAYGVYIPQSTSANMSQEEYDRQAALMLHYQEVQQAQAQQQQQRKSSNCVVS